MRQPGEREWKTPASLTLSPSRQEARSERRAQLRAILLHWERKHPGRTELRGVGEMMPIIPLEPAPGRGYRLTAAAAGSARDLVPASPDPQEAYSPPLEAEGPWTDAGPVGLQPVVGRVPPRVVQPPSSDPTDVGGGAMSLATAYEGTYCLASPESSLGVAGPPVVPFLPEMGLETLGLAPENMETPPPTLSGRRKRTEPLQPCDILEEAATVARILQGSELTDMLQSPMSAFSPPPAVPQVKPEPEEVVRFPTAHLRNAHHRWGHPLITRRPTKTFSNDSEAT